jgi:hypothetical protein
VSATIPQFLALLTAHGSDALYHREHDGSPCPCRTPEGSRDPAWHLDNPAAPICNEVAWLPTVDEFPIKAAIQAVSAGGIRRSRASELIEGMFPGEVRTDDHIGIFPVTWQGHTLELADFSDTGEDYILYDNRRFIIISNDKLPDIDGDPNHHWECGMRITRPDRVNA